MRQIFSYLKLSKKVSLLLFNFFFIALSAQELPPIQNYSPSVYNAENQNWSITQSQEKVIYIANNKGLLIFNGANWHLYESPNETILRSVEEFEDRIYAGYYMEFGFWEKDLTSAQIYTSLSEKFKLKHYEDEEFWNIITLQDGIIFQSLDRIYVYNATEGTIRILETEGKITKSFEVNGSIYFQILGKGLFKIENGKGAILSNNPVLKENQIVKIFDNENSLLILTQNKGFYELSESQLEHWDIQADDQFPNIKIYSAIRLRNESFALGSIANGMLYIDKKGELIYEFNQQHGLQNSTVLSLMEDLDGNIWLGLDNGISYININAPFKIFKNISLGIGSVYAANIFKGYHYLGTNQGLFYKPVNSSEDFKIIDGTQGQVWSLRQVGGALFCGHNNGAYIIKGENAKLIFSLQGVWDIKDFEERSASLLLGSYDGIYVLEKKNNNWQLKNKVSGFNNSARYFEVIGRDIFVNHEYKGVFHLTLDQTFSELKSVVLDTIMKGANSGILKFKEDLLYASNSGVFRYNLEKKTFERDSLLSKSYTIDEYKSGRLLTNERDRPHSALLPTNALSSIYTGSCTTLYCVLMLNFLQCEFRSSHAALS